MMSLSGGGGSSSMESDEAACVLCLRRAAAVLFSAAADLLASSARYRNTMASHGRLQAVRRARGGWALGGEDEYEQQAANAWSTTSLSLFRVRGPLNVNVDQALVL